jgi:hypothetical protein
VQIAKLLAQVQLARLQLAAEDRRTVLLEKASARFEEELDQARSEVLRERAQKKREAKARKAAALRAK